MSAGHTWSSIKEYSLSEIGIFLKAVVSMHTRDRSERLSHAWMGTHLSQKSIKDVLSEMGRTVNKKSKAPEEAAFVESEWKRLIQFQKGAR